MTDDAINLTDPEMFPLGPIVAPTLGDVDVTDVAIAEEVVRDDPFPYVTPAERDMPADALLLTTLNEVRALTALVRGYEFEIRELVKPENLAKLASGMLGGGMFGGML